MADLRGLYQEVILDHSKKPRNYRVLEDANHQAEGYNPLCGDRVTLYIKLENGRWSAVSLKGNLLMIVLEADSPDLAQNLLKHVK